MNDPGDGERREREHKDVDLAAEVVEKATALAVQRALEQERVAERFNRNETQLNSVNASVERTGKELARVAESLRERDDRLTLVERDLKQLISDAAADRVLRVADRRWNATFVFTAAGFVIAALTLLGPRL